MSTDDKHIKVMDPQVEGELRDAREAFDLAVDRMLKASMAADVNLVVRTSEGERVTKRLEWLWPPGQNRAAVRHVHGGWIVDTGRRGNSEHLCATWDEAVTELAKVCGWKAKPGDSLRVTLERP